MGYPWPSFGAFLFLREETPIFGTDVGWINSPSYVRQRPLGGQADSILLTAYGSADRGFELFLTPDRFDELAALMGTQADFTDWPTPNRPFPNTRLATLLEVSPLQFEIRQDRRLGTSRQAIRAKVSLASL